MFAARGLGIWLVILGHGLLVARNWLPDPATEPCLWAVTRWVYAFHMPMFFLLAGWASRTFSEDAGFGTTVRRRAERLLVPYLVFTALVSLVKTWVPQLATAQVEAGAGFLDQVLLHPRANPMSVLWFLYTMFFVSVLGATLAPGRPGRVPRWATLAVLVAAQALPEFDNLLGARDLLTFGLFWWIGYAFPDAWNRVALRPPAWAWLSVAAVPALQFGLEDLVPRFLLMAVTGVAGTVMVLCVGRALLDHVPRRLADGVCRLGRNSMRVYLVSYFVEQGLRISLRAVAGSAVPGWAFVLLDALANPFLALALAAAMARVPFAARLAFGEPPPRRPL